MQYIIVDGNLEEGVSIIVGPYTTKMEAESVLDDLGIDSASVFSMQNHDEYWEEMVCNDDRKK